LPPRALVGRGHELAAIDRFVALDEDGPRVMAFQGAPGSGRTAIVESAGAAGAAAGRRTIAIAGAASEEAIPLSGLSELLLPFAPWIDALPDAHREALSRPLGLASGTAPFDLVSTGMAVLALVDRHAATSPVLITVDDADRVDAETTSVLAFVAKRMDRRRAVLVITAEPHGTPPLFDRSITRASLAPLRDAEAMELLQAQAYPLDAAFLRRIVEQSAGNPLTLVETAETAVRAPATPHSRREPIPVGARVEDRVMATFRGLPVAAQERLVEAAVAERYRWGAARQPATLRSGLTLLDPAERAGIVRIDHSGVHFAQPAFWIAILQGVPFADRVAAHRRIADVLSEQPSERAWHLGRAALDPDESIATMLEDSAGDVGRQLSRLDEALTLERAAELTPDGDRRARRFLSAAVVAAPTGELAWVAALTSRGMSCVRDPVLRVELITVSAWAEAASGRFNAAMADLSRAAAESVDSAPEAAWGVLSIAAAVGYQSGSRATQAQMQRAMSRLAAATEPTSSAAAARSVWIDSYLRPGIGTGARLALLGRLIAEAPTDEPSLSRLAGAAWLSDESHAAFDLADAAYHRLFTEGAHASAAVIGPIRSWTAWDTGRWDDALVFAAHTSRVAEAAGGGMLAATEDAVAALVHAARGDGAAAEARARAALTVIQGEECSSVVCRAHQARGLSAMAAGRYAEAYGHLSRMFREDGTPLHWHISYFGIADMAAAAVRAGQAEAARALLDRILVGFPPEPAVRLHHLSLRARALLAEDDADAERFFAESQGDPTGSRWPFERAQLLLDHGSWLRRRRRNAEAVPLLTTAREVFEGLGASAWQQRAESELRAAHVDVPRTSGGLHELTGQQREIVLLAATGLTNREIASRLYLSPRTVASHLYRSFPKLGIRDRWQLRDLVDAPDEPLGERTEPRPTG
jgi:DNA-binding CsgD family transcriptional regulator